MATKEKSKQKSRDHKESKGSARGAKKSPMTEGWKILNNKGMYQRFTALGGAASRKGGQPRKVRRED